MGTTPDPSSIVEVLAAIAELADGVCWKSASAARAMSTPTFSSSDDLLDGLLEDAPA